MARASENFAILSQLGHVVIEKARQNGWSPNFEKRLPEFTITEAARMCGRSTEAIRQAEKTGKVPAPKLSKPENGGRVKRLYTLGHINLLRDYFKTRPSRGNKPLMTLMYANFKGGVTKSSSALHTAQGLAMDGYRVLLMDLDNQGTPTALLGFSSSVLTADETLLPFFIKPIPGLSDNTKQSYVTSLHSLIKPTYFAGLDIIPANLSLFNAEFEIPFLNATAQHRNIPFQMERILHDGIYGNPDKKY